MSLKTGFKQVALPAELVDHIGQYINEHTEQGYMSIPEFVREAVRMHLKESQTDTSSVKKIPHKKSQF